MWLALKITSRTREVAVKESSSQQLSTTEEEVSSLGYRGKRSCLTDGKLCNVTYTVGDLLD